jgi:hypothetical protein
LHAPGQTAVRQRLETPLNAKTSHLQLGVDDHTGLIDTDIPGSKGMSPSQDVLRLLEIGWTMRQREKISGCLQARREASFEDKLAYMEICLQGEPEVIGCTCVEYFYVLPINDLVEVVAENH